MDGPIPTPRHEIRNPIVPGNWSNPALIKVGDWFYSSSATYGWQPGIPIIRSKNLSDWKYVGRALASPNRIPAGDTRSGVQGVELGYDAQRERFLAFATIFDSGLHLFYANDPAGPWREKHLTNLEADPGFFLDDDGQAYLITSSGILFRFNLESLELEDEIHQFDLSEMEFFEGPSITKRGKYYYLLYTDGGKLPHHPSSISTWRSTSLNGPWETDPNNPQLLSVDKDAKFQGPAHGTLLQISPEKWAVSYHSHELSHYSLGRQMCMSLVEWTKDGWWQSKSGPVPPEIVVIPELNPPLYLPLEKSDTFDSDQLGPEWFGLTDFSKLRKNIYLDDFKNELDLTTSLGPISSDSALNSILGQRISKKEFTIRTRIGLQTNTHGITAGLTFFHSSTQNFWLGIRLDEKRHAVQLGKTVDGHITILEEHPYNDGDEIVSLYINVDGNEKASFAFQTSHSRLLRFTERIYFGDAWKDLRDGRGGDPDLGWVGMEQANVWTPAFAGIFALHHPGDEKQVVEFLDFSILDSFP